MSYWTNRQEQLKKTAEKDEASIKKRLSKFYDAEFKRLDKEIAAYYQKYGEDNVIEYRQLMESLSDEDKRLLMQQMDEFVTKYPQYADLMPVRESIYKLDRLQGLQYSVYMAQANIAGYTNEQIKEYETSLAQKGLNYAMETLGFGKNFYSLNSDAVRQFVDVAWSNGENFSTRIWNDTQKLAQYLNQDMAQGFARGDSYDRLVRNLKKRFERVNRNDAYRLVFTEGTYVMAESTMQPFKDDFEQYRLSPVLDGRTCPICRGLREQVFLISERQPGINFPPIHPWCRCSWEIVVDDWDAWIDDYVEKHGGGETSNKLAKTIEKRVRDNEENAIIKKTGKSTSAKTIDEAIEGLRALGISTPYDYRKVNIDVANMINSEIADMYSTFGNLNNMGVLDEIFVASGKKDWYAAYQRPTASIVLVKNNVQYKSSLKKMGEQAKACFDYGYWSTGEAEHSIRHEIGHAIDYTYLRDNNSPKLSEITKMRESIMKECGIKEWSSDDKEHFKAAGEYLSYYGLKNDKEFVAESIAEFMAGNPRATAQKVVEILMRRE